VISQQFANAHASDGARNQEAGKAARPDREI